MLKTALKSRIKFLIYISGLWKIRLLMRGKDSVTILMYHHVLSEFDYHNETLETSTVVSRDVFNKQMLFLKKHFTIIDFEDLDRIRQNHDEYSRKHKPYAIVTFDDGWRNNYTEAFPVLKQHGIKSIIYLCSDFIDSSNRFWFDSYYRLLVHHMHKPELLKAISKLLLKHGESADFDTLESDSPHQKAGHILARIKDLPPSEIESSLNQLQMSFPCPDIPAATAVTLNEQNIQEMHAQGVKFGSHGQKHYIFTQLMADELNAEIHESKQSIEQLTGSICSSLAYPNGNSSQTVVSETDKAGYRYAVTTEYGVNTIHSPRHQLKRIAIDRNIGETVACFAYRLLFK